MIKPFSCKSYALHSMPWRTGPMASRPPTEGNSGFSAYMLCSGMHSAHPIRVQQVDGFWHCALNLIGSCNSMAAHCYNLRSGGRFGYEPCMSLCLLASSYGMLHTMALHRRERPILP